MYVQDFRIGWISALGDELTAARAILDSEYPKLQGVPDGDDNVYIGGIVGDVNVVIACLPDGKYGNSSAARVARDMTRSFPRLTYTFLVGIGGGVPTDENQMRLGDVVVGVPDKLHNGVVQYELGKLHQNHFQRKGSLNSPPTKALNAIQVISTELGRPPTKNLLRNSILRIFANGAIPKTFVCPGDGYDVLYRKGVEVQRKSREKPRPWIHPGLIGSGDRVIANETERDRLNQLEGIICFEMEAAGVLTVTPCLVIRGISDYADSSKNDRWHGYAALTAAVYASHVIRRMTNATDTEASEATVSAQPTSSSDDFFEICATSHFTGREDHLRRLSEHLISDIEGIKVSVLAGMAGVGKTQLAAKWASLHGAEFEAVIWLDGKTNTSLEQSLNRTPQVSCTSNQLSSDKHWLWNDGRWLVIVDNVDLDYRAPAADRESFNTERYLPSKRSCASIITSRLSSWPKRFQVLKVGRLSDEDSQSLLRKCAEKPLEDSGDLRALCDHLDGLPLALALAGRFIKETGTSVAEYLRHYEHAWVGLLSLQQRYPLPEYEKSMLSSLLVTFEQVVRDCPEAAMLLCLCSFFDRRTLSFRTFNIASSQNTNRTISDWPKKQIAIDNSCSKIIRKLLSDRLAFTRVVWVLARYSVIDLADDPNEDHKFSMHAVLHDWCFHKMFTNRTSAERFCIAMEANQALLGRIMYSKPNSERDDDRVARLEHVYADCITYMSRLKSIDLSSIATQSSLISVLIDRHLARFLLDYNKVEEAHLVLRHLIGHEARSDTSGRQLERLSHLYITQGNAFRRQGLLEQAFEAYSQALGHDISSWPKAEEQTIESLEGIGSLYAQKGQRSQADQVFDRTLGDRKVANQPYQAVLDSLVTRTRRLAKSHNAESMQSLLKQVYEGRLAELGTADPKTIEAACNLVNFQLGRLSEDSSYANSLRVMPKDLAFRETVDILRSAYDGIVQRHGTRHWLYIRVGTLYGNVLILKRDTKSALHLHKQVLKASADITPLPLEIIRKVLENWGNASLDGTENSLQSIATPFLRAYERIIGFHHTELQEDTKKHLDGLPFKFLDVFPWHFRLIEACESKSGVPTAATIRYRLELANLSTRNIEIQHVEMSKAQLSIFRAILTPFTNMSRKKLPPAEEKLFTKGVLMSAAYHMYARLHAQACNIMSEYINGKFYDDSQEDTFSALLGEDFVQMQTLIRCSAELYIKNLKKGKESTLIRCSYQQVPLEDFRGERSLKAKFAAISLAYALLQKEEGNVEEAKANMAVLLQEMSGLMPYERVADPDCIYSPAEMSKIIRREFSNLVTPTAAKPTNEPLTQTVKGYFKSFFSNRG